MTTNVAFVTKDVGQYMPHLLYVQELKYDFLSFEVRRGSGNKIVIDFAIESAKPTLGRNSVTTRLGYRLKLSIDFHRHHFHIHPPIQPCSESQFRYCCRQAISPPHLIKDKVPKAIGNNPTAVTFGALQNMRMMTEDHITARINQLVG